MWDKICRNIMCKVLHLSNETDFFAEFVITLQTWNYVSLNLLHLLYRWTCLRSCTIVRTATVSCCSRWYYNICVTKVEQLNIIMSSEWYSFWPLRIVQCCPSPAIRWISLFVTFSCSSELNKLGKKRISNQLLPLEALWQEWTFKAKPFKSVMITGKSAGVGV